MSLDEYADVRLERALEPEALAAMIERMNEACPSGLKFRSVARLGQEDATIPRVITGARYVIAMARSAVVTAPGERAEEALAARCRAAMEAATLPIRRQVEGIGKMIDVRSYLSRATVGGDDTRAALAQAGLVGDLVALDVFVSITGQGAAKSSEIAAVIAGDGAAPPHRALRLELFGGTGDARVSPMDLPTLRKMRERPPQPSLASTIAADAE
jgi:hypothetical protein